jgi:hypothetical protein
MRWRWAFGEFGVRREGNRVLVVIEYREKQLGIYRLRWDNYVEVAHQDTE